jgi:hypothetical protein
MDEHSEHTRDRLDMAIDLMQLKRKQAKRKEHIEFIDQWLAKAIELRKQYDDPIT